MKIFLGACLLLLSFSSCFSSGNNFEKEELINKIKSDTGFHKLMAEKKSLFLLITENTFGIDDSTFTLVKASSSKATNHNELLQVYSSYNIPSGFVELTDKIAISTYILKTKYEVYKYPGIWLEIQKNSFDETAIDYEAAFKNEMTKQDLLNYAACSEKNLDLCKKNWGQFIKNARQQLWEITGNFCNSNSPESNDEPMVRLRRNMECNLTALKFYSQKKGCGI